MANRRLAAEAPVDHERKRVAFLDVLAERQQLAEHVASQVKRLDWTLAELVEAAESCKSVEPWHDGQH